MKAQLFILAFLLLLPVFLNSQTTVSKGKAELFKDVSAETGLNFRHYNGSTGQYYLCEIMGAGAALFDYDGDGDLDVFLLQGGVLDPKAGPSRSPRQFSARLFRNELKPKGRLEFTDVTTQAGVGYQGYGMGVAVGDYDNDGDLDLYVTGFGSNVLYRNNGDGTFTDVTRQAGVDDARWSTSAAFLDYDRDGKLDLFVTNYIAFTVANNKVCHDPVGERDYCRPSAYAPVPARLFHNEGNGKFIDVTEAAGISKAYGPGLGVVCADFNGDGWVDIYVANDGAANLLWINKGNGTFEESGLLSGAAYADDGVARAGMGVAAEDFDNDGDEDLLVSNLRREGATLFRNGGNGLFSDASAQFGLARATFLYTGFGLGWFDLDNDGYLDLFVANGAVNILEELRGTPFPYHQKNQLFLNMAGQRFREITDEAGPALKLSDVSRGAAFGDIDNDGDIDVLVTNNNGPARLLLNQLKSSNHWLSVRLEGVKDNRSGIGARVGVLRQGQKILWRRAHSDGSYLCASDLRVHFGLGRDPSLEAVIVQWPNGTREAWNDIHADRFVTLRQGSGSSTTTGQVAARQHSHQLP